MEEGGAGRSAAEFCRSTLSGDHSMFSYFHRANFVAFSKIS
jgi:hypothetical protein